MIDPMQVITLAVGGSGVLGAIVAFRRAGPEKRKMNAETAALITTTAGKWVMEADDRMEELAAELRALKTDQRKRDELLAVHAQWDRQVFWALKDAGIDHLPAAPPIYLPQTG
jgi:hypothetical protein